MKLEARLQLEMQNQAKIEAELVTERQGRQIAEQLLKQREQMLLQHQQEAAAQNTQIKSLTRSLRLAKKITTVQNSFNAQQRVLWPVALILVIVLAATTILCPTQTQQTPEHGAP